MKLTPETTIKLLEAYEANRCLWDMHSEDYKNKVRRETAYGDISRIMNIDGFDTNSVKAKLRSLRNTYTLERYKIMRSRLSGKSQDVYKPKVAWYPIADRILHGVVQIKELQPTEMIVVKNEGEAEEEFHSLHKMKSENESFDENFDYNDVNELTMTSIASDSTQQENLFELEPVIPERYDIDVSREKNFEDSHYTYKQSDKIQSAEDNEFDVFGKHIACQLKRLPEVVALESMAFIQSYIVEQRLKALKSNVKQSNQQLNSFKKYSV